MASGRTKLVIDRFFNRQTTVWRKRRFNREPIDLFRLRRTSKHYSNHSREQTETHKTQALLDHVDSVQ